MVFSRVYNKDLFNNVQIIDRSKSRSGTGSSLHQTRELKSALPLLFKKYNIKTLLDIPCGDFYWMQNVNLNGIKYTGGDIVSKIISNNKKYTSNFIQFKKLDILNDKLPKSDLILCRDLFVHLTYDQVFCALNNIRESGSKYLLATSYKCRETNKDIKEVGNWRPLNMEIAPFF